MGVKYIWNRDIDKCITDNPPILLYVRPKFSFYVKAKISNIPIVGYIGCEADVTTNMDAMCSGRHSCDIEVRDIGEVSKPCRRDFTSYLEADFKCIKGEYIAMKFDS